MSTNTAGRSALTIALLLLLVLLATPLLLGVMGFGMMGYGMPMMGWAFRGDVPGWMPVVAVVIQLAVLAVVLGGGYLLLRSFVGSSGSDGDAAMEELRSAYARGDLSDEEFERRRERLRRQE